MLSKFAQTVVSRPKLTVLGWVVISLFALLSLTTSWGGASLWEGLQAKALEVPGSPSARAAQILNENTDSNYQISLLVQGLDVSAHTSEIKTVLDSATKDLASIPGVKPTGVIHPFVAGTDASDPVAAGLMKRFTAGDGKGFLLVVVADLTQFPQRAAETRQAVEKALAAIPSDLKSFSTRVDYVISDQALLSQAIADQARQDLTLSQWLSLPLVFILLLVVFGGLLVAALPVAMALLASVLALTCLYLLSLGLPIQAYAVNVVVLLAMALALSYTLFLVWRYREELYRQDDIQLLLTGEIPTAKLRRRTRRKAPSARFAQALILTMASAGRTVLISSCAVIISLLALLVFTPPAIRALALAGLFTVALVAASCLTLLPALMYLAGPRMERDSLLARLPGVARALRLPAANTYLRRAVQRCLSFVQARPWPFAVAPVIVLLIFSLGALGVSARSTVYEQVPKASEQALFLNTLKAQYPETSATPDARILVRTEEEAAAAFAAQVQRVKNVKSVALDPVQVEGYRVLNVAFSGTSPADSQALGAVRQIRALNPDFQTLVAGAAAAQLDFRSATLKSAPWAVLLIVLCGGGLLYLLTRSFTLSLQALFTSGLTVTAALGISAWIFQDGHFSTLLGFSSVGSLEAAIVLVVLCLGFGLTTDHEMFLLSRLKEAHDIDPTQSGLLPRTIARTRRFTLSAALAMILVFFSAVFSHSLPVKELGVSLVLVLVLNATLVRLLLVPALMSLLSKWNWLPLSALGADTAEGWHNIKPEN